MKILKNLTEQIKKLDGIYGLIIKIFLIVSLIYFSVLFISFIVRISYNTFFQQNVIFRDTPVRDVAVLDKILLRLNEENIKVTVTPRGVLLVENKIIARRARAILVREDLAPYNIEPWQIFDRPRWNITDFERNVNLQRARELMIRDHIKTIDGIHDVNLQIAWSAGSNPSTVSLIIISIQGSDIIKNQQKLKGIEKYLINSIEGLLKENIVILDHEGYVINNFE